MRSHTNISPSIFLVHLLLYTNLDERRPRQAYRSWMIRFLAAHFSGSIGLVSFSIEILYLISKRPNNVAGSVNERYVRRKALAYVTSGCLCHVSRSTNFKRVPPLTSTSLVLASTINTMSSLSSSSSSSKETVLIAERVKLFSLEYMFYIFFLRFIVWRNIKVATARR